MSWTYTASPDNSTTIGRRDAVRLYIGDTDSSNQQVQDAEIDFALSQNDNNLYAAAASVCGMLAGKYSRDVDVTIDGVSRSASQRSSYYTKLAREFESKAATSGGGLGTPYVGGVSIAERDSVNEDSDRIEPAFERGGFDNPQRSTIDDIYDN